MSTKSRRSAVALVAAALLLSPLAACGEDDGGERTNTTHTRPPAAESPDASEPEVDPQVLAEIDGRGAPTPEPVEGAVDELQIIDDVEGTGAEVTEGATVTAHYVGVVAATGEKFDASWDRGEPTSFSLNQVIQGWSEGLVGMKVGGRRTLVIPAAMAYGPNPPPGSNIPADAPLVFTVDMAAVS